MEQEMTIVLQVDEPTARAVHKALGEAIRELSADIRINGWEHERAQLNALSDVWLQFHNAITGKVTP